MIFCPLLVSTLVLGFNMTPGGGGGQTERDGGGSFLDMAVSNIQQQYRNAISSLKYTLSSYEYKPATSFVDVLLGLSECVFLYVRYVLPP